MSYQTGQLERIEINGWSQCERRLSSGELRQRLEGGFNHRVTQELGKILGFT